MNQQTYTAVVQQSEGWWIGWIEELPGVNAQETTYEALLDSLRVCLAESIEMNRQDALAAAGPNYREEVITL
ncbi:MULTISPECIES: type II toxin-antitoxin system HicB family antitoxin [Methylococcus]|uniref:Type II toxin-antitoxin system HicB family antitoxin n=1 Tax=Methylococcus capsulatus TaxID=414 RepID=A0ABZ2F1Y4_METCP|nr:MULTISPECIES: hypothetical protein [Methylococcus]MDF9391931.1 type II toxin-antitoxin system HicB family antitoxin [Methylococcus capsulatus]